MGRKFREWQPDAGWLFPPSPRDWLPEDHLVYSLLDVTDQIDVSPGVDDYHSDKGGQLLQVGRLSLDGTKIKANASRHKATRYDRMQPEIEKLQNEIKALMTRAKGADAAEAQRSDSAISQGSPTEEPDAETEDGSSSWHEKGASRIRSSEGDHRTGVRSDQIEPWLSRIFAARA